MTALLRVALWLLLPLAAHQALFARVRPVASVTLSPGEITVPMSPPAYAQQPPPASPSLPRSADDARPVAIQGCPVGYSPAPPAPIDPAHPVDSTGVLVCAPNAAPSRAEARQSVAKSSKVTWCLTDMPCALPPEDALRQAYQYCRADYAIPGGSVCVVDPETKAPSDCEVITTDATSFPPGPAGYTLPACDVIAKRWEQSLWKKQDDRRDAAMRKQELDHSRAFIEAVAGQK